MGRLAEVMKEHSLTTAARVRASDGLEGHQEADTRLKERRLRKRQTKPDGTYAAENLAKPRSGRGVSAKQAAAALEDRPLPRKVRSKVTRALNTLLAKKGQAALETAALFAGVPARVSAKKDAVKKS
jgi:hypothetical protein